MAVGEKCLLLGFRSDVINVVGWFVVAMLSVCVGFNAAGVKDVLLSLFNQILGA